MELEAENPSAAVASLAATQSGKLSAEAHLSLAKAAEDLKATCSSHRG